MGPSLLVTIAETDRGAMGQSGVGVLNELSRIQTASVSRGMDEWPDSLSTSFFLSDFPALPLSLSLSPSLSLSLSSCSISPSLSNFLTLLSPPKSLHCVSSFFSPYISLPSASHFGYPFLPSSLLSLPLSLTPSLSALCTFSLFSHFHSKLFESFPPPQQWAALSELQPCFHSERRSTWALRYPNFHPWQFFL